MKTALSILKDKTVILGVLQHTGLHRLPVYSKK